MTFIGIYDRYIWIVNDSEKVVVKYTFSMPLVKHPCM